MKNSKMARAGLIFIMAFVVLAGTPKPSHANIFGDIWSGVSNFFAIDGWFDSNVLDRMPDPFGWHQNWHENNGDVQDDGSQQPMMIN